LIFVAFPESFGQANTGCSRIRTLFKSVVTCLHM